MMTKKELDNGKKFSWASPVGDSLNAYLSQEEGGYVIEFNGKIEVREQYVSVLNRKVRMKLVKYGMFKVEPKKKTHLKDYTEEELEQAF